MEKKTRNSQHHLQHRGQHWTCAKTLIEAGARTKIWLLWLWLNNIEYMSYKSPLSWSFPLFTLIIVKEAIVSVFWCSRFFLLLTHSDSLFLLECVGLDVPSPCRSDGSDGHHGHRLLLESMQQRLLDQQTLAQRLREDLSAAKLEEERAQDVAPRS